MGLENYEELKFCGIANLSGLTFQAPVVTAGVGGYYAGWATAAYGLKQWTLSSTVLPDTENYPVTFTLSGEEVTTTRYRYLMDFFERHRLSNNKPFILRDPDTGKRFMVSFADAEASAERMYYQIYGGWSLTLEERRVAGVDFAEDGSIIEPFVEIGFYMDGGEFSADAGEFAASF